MSPLFQKNDESQSTSNLPIWLMRVFFFLVPIFFLPTTAEFFNFHRLYLLVGGAMVFTLIWLVQGLRKNKLSLRISPILSVLGILLGAYLISTLFSIDTTESLLGGYGVFHNSLISMIALFLLTISMGSLINSDNEVKSILTAFVMGLTLSTAWSLLQYSGLSPLNADWAQNQFFTPVGSPTILTILCAASLSLILGLLAGQENKLNVNSLGYLVMGAILSATIIVFSNISGLFVLVAGIAGLMLIMPNKQLSSLKIPSAIFAFIMVLTALAAWVPSISQKISLQRPEGSMETRLSLAQSWRVAATAQREYPLTGSGPGTFLVDFTRFKPASLNQTDFWNNRFQLPYNEPFLVIATMGLLGLLVYGYFFLMTVKLSILDLLKERAKNPWIAGVGAFVFALIMGQLTAPATTLLTTALVLGLLALIVVRQGNVRKIELNLHQGYVVIITLALLSTLGIGYVGGKFYMAEMENWKSIQALSAGEVGSAYRNQQNALQYAPWLSHYHRNFALTSLIVANALTQNKDLTELDQQNVVELVRQAIRESSEVTINQDSLDVRNWETRGQIFTNIVSVLDNAQTFAIEAYQKAINLDPLNPSLRLNLGGIYYNQKDYASAISLFADAVQIKPDYANAHYNLASALRDQGNYVSAYQQMQAVIDLMPQDSQDYQKAKTELDELEPKARQQAEEQNKNLQNGNPITTTDTTTDTNQQPLTQPGDQPNNL